MRWIVGHQATAPHCLTQIVIRSLITSEYIMTSSFRVFVFAERTFDAAKHFDTLPELVDRKFNRPTREMLQKKKQLELNEETIVVSVRYEPCPTTPSLMLPKNHTLPNPAHSISPKCKCFGPLLRVSPPISSPTSRTACRCSANRLRQ